MPFRIPSPFFDRSVAFEEAYEIDWRRSFKSKAFEEDLNNLYKGVSNRSASGTPLFRPALLLNSTNVETGKRFIVSSLSLKSERVSDAYFAYDNAYDNNAPYRIDAMPLSSALDLAARFCYVSSQGVLWSSPSSTTRKLIAGKVPDSLPWGRLVDGGYFDDSGMATLIDIVQAIAKDIPRRRLAKESQTPLRFLVVYISNGEKDVSAPGPDGAPPSPPSRPVEPPKIVVDQYDEHNYQRLDDDYPSILRTSEPLSEVTSPIFGWLHAGWAHGDPEGAIVTELVEQLNNRSRGTCKDTADRCGPYFEISYGQFLRAYKARVDLDNCRSPKMAATDFCRGILYTTQPGLGWLLSRKSQEAMSTLAICAGRDGMDGAPKKADPLLPRYSPPFAALDEFYGTSIVKRSGCTPPGLRVQGQKSPP